MNGNTGGGIAVAGDAVDPLGNPNPALGNRIEHNTAHNNGSDGIAVGGVGHTVGGNAANNNDGWGISVEADNVDGGGNTANGNAEPDQCTGVVCAPGAAVPTLAPDITAPDTTITEGPANPTSGFQAARFTFTGNDNVAPVTALRFECRLDAPPDPPQDPDPDPDPPDPTEPPEPPDIPEGENWGTCVSPRVFQFMPTGEHKFEVRAIDPFGNFDATPAEYIWKVVPAAPGPDATPPSTTIFEQPDTASTSPSATFAFRGSDNATPGPHLSFQCRLDSTNEADFAPCTSPVTLTGLALGSHTFDVRAVDLARQRRPDAGQRHLDGRRSTTRRRPA